MRSLFAVTNEGTCATAVRVNEFESIVFSVRGNESGQEVVISYSIDSSARYLGLPRPEQERIALDLAARQFSNMALENAIMLANKLVPNSAQDFLNLFTGALKRIFVTVEEELVVLVKSKGGGSRSLPSLLLDSLIQKGLASLGTPLGEEKYLIF